MTELDYTSFAVMVDRMLTVFGRKPPAKERADLTRTLFTLFAPHTLDDVLAAGQRAMSKTRTFPKPIDWLAELPATAGACPPDRRQMHVDEIAELTRATAMRYEDLPCQCRECCEHGVDRRPLRFVPTLTGVGDTYERAYNAQRRQSEIVGHWAHGAELARWYQARAVWTALKRRAPRALVAAAEALVGETREPGEEG